jgi:hypothetical protein
MPQAQLQMMKENWVRSGGKRYTEGGLRELVRRSNKLGCVTRSAGAEFQYNNVSAEKFITAKGCPTV